MRHHANPERDNLLIYVKPREGRGYAGSVMRPTEKTKGILDEVPLKCLFQKSLEIHIDEVQIVWPAGRRQSTALHCAINIHQRRGHGSFLCTNRIITLK